MSDERTRPVRALSASTGPLVSGYDVIMFDLDGVLYRGDEPVPHAAAGVQRAREAGASVAFVTNNASRRPEDVAALLHQVGIAADAADVVTSAQAAARLVAAEVPTGSAVLVVGGVGLEAALREHGLRPVRELADGPAAVVQGYSADVAWTHLAEASYAVTAGLFWVASNTDRTIPTARGIAPGNGTLVAAVAAPSGRHPVVAGKPQAPLFDETVLRVGGGRPLVVGDRLDTDIEGANVVGADSLLVLTGVDGAQEVCNADPIRRPTFIAPDLRGLDQPQAWVAAVDDFVVGHGVRCGPWRATVTAAGALELEHDSVPDPAHEIARWRAGVAAAWAWRDAQTPSDRVVDVSVLADPS